jgi:tryptophan aminotransferase
MPERPASLLQVRPANYVSHPFRLCPPFRAVRGLFPLEQIPGMISLLAGKPNPATYPITGITLQTLRPPSNPPDPSVDSDADVFANAERVELEVEPAHVAAGLQYGPTAGFGPLLEWLGGLQEREHGRKPEGEGWRMTIGGGSQDLIYKAAHAMLNPGDPILVESPAYA